MIRFLLNSVLLLLVLAPPAPAEEFCRSASDQLRQGVHHLDRGEADAALARLSEAGAIAAQCTRVYFPLGLALERTGKHDRAIEAYTLALAPDATDVDRAAAYYRRGLAYGRKGHFDRETEDYSKATVLRPDIDVSTQATREDWIDPEIEAYTAAIASDPGDVWAHYNRGIALRQKGRTTEAVEDFRRAVSVDPRHVWSYYHLGCGLRTLGFLDQAAETFGRALAADPTLAWARYNRGLILSRQGHYAAAAEDFTKALELDAAYAWAYFDRGYARFKEKKFPLAIEDFERALAIAPDFVPLQRLCAAALLGREGAVAKPGQGKVARP